MSPWLIIVLGIYLCGVLYVLFEYWREIGRDVWRHYMFPANILLVLLPWGVFYIIGAVLWPIVLPFAFLCSKAPPGVNTDGN